MLKKFANDILIGSGPARLSDKLHRKGNDVFFSFSPQRSGQHLVIRWICLGLGEILHVNHVRGFPRLGGPVLLPMAGRTTLYSDTKEEDSGKRSPHRLPNLANSSACYSTEFWTLEDIAPDDPLYTEAIGYTDNFGGDRLKTFLILRDPANWLASSRKHGKWGPAKLREKVEIYLRTLRVARESAERDDTVTIRFNDFVTDATYRAALSEQIPEHRLDRAEPALSEVPDFGGGSSFSGHSGVAGEGVSDRWRTYAADAEFRDLLSGEELRQIANEVFGEDHLAFLDTAA